MRFGIVVKINRDFSDTIKAEGYFPALDKGAYKKGYKRVGSPVVRSGECGDDFVQDVFSIAITATCYRIPRIINPIYRRK